MGEEELAANVDQVAGVLQQLKSEIRRQQRQWQEAGLVEDLPAAGAKPPAVLEAAQATMRVNPHLPIAWPAWPPGVWPKVVAATQKLVRRLLAWYINPIVEQQNRHNAAVVQTLDLLWVEMAGIKAQIAEQQAAATEDEGRP